MDGTFEKPSRRKWRESISNMLSSRLPGLRTMPPTNADQTVTHQPLCSISGGGMPHCAGSITIITMATEDIPPKSSTFSTFSVDGPVCRICHDVKDESGSKKLISPCGCTGSAQYVHKTCLQKWTKLKGASTCEICHQVYQKKYVKFKMTSSEENTVASAITILLLLLGVLSVGVYLLAEYLVKVAREPSAAHRSSEIWVSFSLVTIGSLSLLVFLPWFICFCARMGKTPRSVSRSEGDGDGRSTMDTSLESSVTNLSEGSGLDDAQMAYEQIHEIGIHTINETNSTDLSEQTTASETARTNDKGAYVNQLVQVDGAYEDNIDTSNPAVLFV